MHSCKLLIFLNLDHPLDHHLDHPLDLQSHLQLTPDAWRELYDSPTPLTLALPGDFGAEGRLDAFQRLLVLRCIIPDKLVPAIQVIC